MTSTEHGGFARSWKDIASALLRLGATSYGGPAIMGVMQAELQEKRQWVPRGRFVEGLSLVNMLPGATATQLGIFLGYARGGWWGGLLGGLCFVLPAFSSVAVVAVLPVAWWSTPAAVSAVPPGTPHTSSLVDIGAYFFKVGAFTVGGGLTMIAFIQQQVVEQFQWLTPQEFIDGLALGQFPPGPLLMVAAYVGYKVAGCACVAVGAPVASPPSL